MINEYNTYQLLKHNTFGIEATARHFVEFSCEEDIIAFIGNGFNGKSLVIGGGSNLLFVNDFDGTVFHSRIMGVEVVEENDDDVLIRVGSGMNWDELVAYCVEHGWHGLENLSLIPGEVGASAVQNVGAYGVEAGDLIERVEAIALENAGKRIFFHDDCCFAYRYSIFKAEEKGRNIITYVTYRLKKSDAFKLNYGNLRERVEALGGATLGNVRRAVCEIRRAKLPDPAEIGSAGSFFMNPVVSASLAAQLLSQYPNMPQYSLADGNVKLSAGWMIEQCGWKDNPHANVGVYRHQALVVVNLGSATGRDVLEFASAVVESVNEKFGVRLNMEVNVIS
ncbi:MAG: UDP-N-acetylmuramate dehydrogenase [Bacteroidaceae bacterium]|nr:UDP-N-acetylmuramate dehydrogenase [Bacteroidaceae bacterium]